MEEKQTHIEEKTKEYKVTLSIEHNEHKTTLKEEVTIFVSYLLKFFSGIAALVCFALYMYFLAGRSWGKTLIFFLLFGFFCGVNGLCIDKINELSPDRESRKPLKYLFHYFY